MALPFIAESTASAIIGKLVDACLSYLEVYPAPSGMQDELERLQRTIPQVQAILTAVEGSVPVMEKNKALDTWLWQFRDAMENAEDVVDELEYYKLKKTIEEARDDEVRGFISNCKRKFHSLSDFFSNDTRKRLREAIKELDQVTTDMKPLLELLTGFYGPSVKRQKLEDIMKARETSFLLTESEVLGRDEERNQIVEWLIKPVDADIDVSAFTIVGMGGLGKTTLAQLICRDERVREYFNPVMWVCVSLDFDVTAITRKILQCVDSGKNYGDKNLQALHVDLTQELKSKRFLLILDDVWTDDNRTEWETLVAPLKFGQRGSKILLTTRMGSVADMAAKVMKCKRESLNLNELKESDCMSLFNKHAFLNVNLDNYRNLQLIGEQIVKKLGGNPLAIKIMGGLLNYRMDYESWKNILEEDIMKLQQGNAGIKTVLRLSYDHLPANLQLCFRYCSLFPQDHAFTRKKLVNMWIGSGLIPESIRGGQRHPEDIGKEYLNLLTRKSFFTCKTRENMFTVAIKLPKEYFMHDLLHDLAQSVSLGECIRVGGDVSRITVPKTVRHLSVEMVNLLSIKEISNLKNLRSLVISCKEHSTQNARHIHKFLEVKKGFKKLRLLIFDTRIISSKLPEALSSLIHLRYLSFPQLGADIKYDGLTNLVNLHLLYVPNHVREKISYISKLPFIHILQGFVVREKSGSKIGELKNLRDLRLLCIKKLENVSSPKEAIEANLNEKKYLKSLLLDWSSPEEAIEATDRFNSAEANEQLLGNLCPHINLKKISIIRYQGVKSPYWMTNQSLVNLTSIKLTDCIEWEHLPPLGQFSSLKYLSLSGLHALKQIDCSFIRSSGECAFPSLKTLQLRDMPNLEEWIGIDDRCIFPQLYCMHISGCPNLREFPTLPYSLREVEISKVGLTALPTINQDYAENNQQEHFQALFRLDIRECEKLEYVPPEFFGKIKTIKDLSIEKCPKLTKRGISDIQLPSILNRLTFGPCGDLEVPLLWSANLSSLSSLEFNDCARIESLPPAQVCARWTMLSYLTIRNCKELSSFGGIQALVSLRRLIIEGCDKLIEVALLPQPPFPNDAGQKEDAADRFLKNGELFIDHHAPLLMEPLRSLSSLRKLLLLDASQLTSLPLEWLLQNHAALEDLQIRNASSLQSLPDLPTSLRHLFIGNCHPVLKKRCQRNIGPDWPKIAHIPRVIIN